MFSQTLKDSPSSSWAGSRPTESPPRPKMNALDFVCPWMVVNTKHNTIRKVIGFNLNSESLLSARLFSQIMPGGVKEILVSTAYRFLPLKRPWLVQIYRTTTVSEDISMTYFLGQSNRIYTLFSNKNWLFKIDPRILLWLSLINNSVMNRNFGPTE